jgi:Zn finger protein HypA/HybF involved in hydrogenase expression
MVRCVGCQKTVSGQRAAFERSWCKHSFEDSDLVWWRCPQCNHIHHLEVRATAWDKQGAQFNQLN